MGELADYNSSLRKRAAGQLAFPKHLEQYLVEERTTRILDVGAGPHSVIGLVGASSPIEIVAIDPLADSYNEMLDSMNIVPSIKTIVGEAERIAEYDFGIFDLVYSRNALDHSYDPVSAIEAMLSVLDPKGAIHLDGSINEGEKQKYGGMHQWNFEPGEDGDLVIWRKSEYVSLRDQLGSKASVSACGTSGGWYNTTIRLCK